MTAPSDREFEFATRGRDATLAAIERDSRADLERLLAANKMARGDLADITRRAAESLECIAERAPPPASLVELLVALLGVKPNQRSVKNRVMFLRAAAHKAKNPDATASAIRCAIRGDFRTIKAWLGDKEFQELVALYRAHKNAIPKFPETRLRSGA